MKVYIIHNWDGSPDEPMLQWLKSSLEARDYTVTIPAMPDPATPKIDDWVEKLTRTISPNEQTVLIGHSIGCQTILRYLATLPPNKKFAETVLIAPWMQLNEKTIKKEGKEVVAIAKPWIETPIDFEKVKAGAGKIVAIFSDNDKYVPLDQKIIFEEKLRARIITEKNKGHFTADDGVKTLPSALNAVLEL